MLTVFNCYGHLLHVVGSLLIVEVHIIIFSFYFNRTLHDIFRNKNTQACFGVMGIWTLSIVMYYKRTLNITTFPPSDERVGDTYRVGSFRKS
jgi:hypothetical protein